MDTNSHSPTTLSNEPLGQPVVLVVDSDARSLRLLEVGLRQAGYLVATSASAAEALAQAESAPPVVALIDVDLPDMDGFGLAARLRGLPGCEHLLVLFLVEPRRPSDRMRAVEVGASDVLDKPVYLKEALWRVETLLEKAAQRGELGGGREGAARFSGALSGTTILDLLQSMELAHKSGLVHCQNARGQRGSLYISDGKAIDAEVGPLRGEEAVYRLLTWRDGEYRVDLIEVLRPDRIARTASGLILEAARRLDEWNQLCTMLPPLDTVLVSNPTADRSMGLDAEIEDVLGSFNGQRTILDVVEMDEELPLDALGRLGAVAKLFSQRLLVSRSPMLTYETRRTSYTPSPIARLTPPMAPRLTPPPMQVTHGRFNPTPVATPAQAAMARLTPPPTSAGRLTPPPAARLTPPPMPSSARLTPPPMSSARLTPPPAARLTPPPTPQHGMGLGARLTPSPAARLTPSPFGSNHAAAQAEIMAAMEQLGPPQPTTVEHSAPTVAPPPSSMSPLSALDAAAITSVSGILELSATELLPAELLQSSDSSIRPIPVSVPPMAVATAAPAPAPAAAQPVHHSAPTRAPAEPLPQLKKPESLVTSLPDLAARSGLNFSPVRSQPSAPPVAEPSQFWRHVLTGVVGLGLFGLGMGLYWVFLVLTRPADAPTAATAPAPLPSQAAAPVTPPSAAIPIAPPPAPPPVAPAPEAAAPPVAAPPAQPEPAQAPALAAARAPAEPPAPAAAPTPAPAEPKAAPPAPASDGYDALVEKARAALKRGQLSQSKHAVRDAMKLRPQGAAAMVVQAEVAIDEGDADAATRLAKKALQLEPSVADAYLVLGMAAQAHAQVAVARGYFKKYLELAPNGDRAKDVKAILRSGY